jgi:phosphoglycerate dehydrogenase-like enzyme
MTRIAVASRSFSKNLLLRAALSAQYPDVIFNDAGTSLAGEELCDFLKDAEMAILGLERIDADVLKRTPRLKVISRFGVGLDSLDLEAVSKAGIKVAYTAGANKRAVAELVIAFALTMLRSLPAVNQEMRAGIWKQHKGRELSHCKVGIVGLGAVGKDLASLLNAFHCDIYAYDPIENKDYCYTHHIRPYALNDLLKQADVVSLHVPLNAATRHLLNAERLSLMKPSAFLINAARGGLVDETALKTMLKNNLLAGAAFDVFESEPPQDQELISLPNFFATPHIGGSTEEAIVAMGYAAIEGLQTAVPIDYQSSVCI